MLCGMTIPASMVVAQIESLLDAYDHSGVASLSFDNPLSLIHDPPAARDVRALRTRLAAGVDRLAPSNSTYVREARALTGDDWFVAQRLAGILNALRDDYSAGYMATVEELVHADLFDDFLDMAQELVNKNYKDAAAVIAGSVLEEHLRKLAGLNAVATRTGSSHKKADTINADLVKAGVYNKLEQKNVTAWLGLRNDAAHGNYESYTTSQVQTMLTNVRDFMTRHPA